MRSDCISPPIHPCSWLCGEAMTYLLCRRVGGDTQTHLKPCPITSPDRSDLPDFSRACIEKHGKAWIHHHFDKMCRGCKHAAKSAKSTGHEDAVSDMLCQVTSTESEPAWPTTSLISSQMNIQWEDYDHFGFPLTVPQAHSFVSAMADTCCQSCLADLKVVKKLGVSVRDLIPVDLKMKAANNDSIRRHSNIIEIIRKE